MQLNAVLLCSFVRIVFKPMQLSFQRKIEAASGRRPVTQGIEPFSNIQIAIARKEIGFVRMLLILKEKKAVP